MVGFRVCTGNVGVRPPEVNINKDKLWRCLGEEFTYSSILVLRNDMTETDPSLIHS